MCIVSINFDQVMGPVKPMHAVNTDLPTPSPTDPSITTRHGERRGFPMPETTMPRCIPATDWSTWWISVPCSRILTPMSMILLPTILS